MPDRRRHRGRHPEDDRLFADPVHETLRIAVDEFSWLLSRGYAEPSALKIVGDRHSLDARQRMGVRRSACSDAALASRSARLVTAQMLDGRPIAIDGHNLLITLEGALGGAPIFAGRDGSFRDLAGIHGAYRKVAETIPALELAVAYLMSLDTRRVDWFLDRPVSNSGRVKALVAAAVQRHDFGAACKTWETSLLDQPDAALRSYGGVVATSDSAILDFCGPWLNLAAEIIRVKIPQVRLIDLRPRRSTP